MPTLPITRTKTWLNTGRREREGNIVSFVSLIISNCCQKCHRRWCSDAYRLSHANAELEKCLRDSGARVGYFSRTFVLFARVECRPIFIAKSIQFVFVRTSQSSRHYQLTFQIYIFFSVIITFTAIRNGAVDSSFILCIPVRTMSPTHSINEQLSFFPWYDSAINCSNQLIQSSMHFDYVLDIPVGHESRSR